MQEPGIVGQLPPRAGNSIGCVAEEAMHAIDTASDADALYVYVGAFCRRIGFDYFSYFLSDPLRLAEKPVIDPMVATSYPESWRNHYSSLGFQQQDPVLSSGISARRPFVWGDRDYVSRLKGKARQVLDDARSFGIQGGVSVPIYGPTGDSGLLSISSHQSGAAFAGIVRETLPVLHLVAHRMHAVMIERLLQPLARSEVRLTEQERVCLLWTLHGKTSWEIAQIIGRSPAAVNFHLQKILRKLGTTSKSRAAIVALRAGLI
jgi:LuxR family quorum-sensing system transcriptional regulator CciR